MTFIQNVKGGGGILHFDVGNWKGGGGKGKMTLIEQLLSRCKGIEGHIPWLAVHLYTNTPRVP